ncbi:MAG: hypothetical protein GQ574_15250 [Crocinitomix sp.]|nr:hypothetical protein [Crocinitomix sp.]
MKKPIAILLILFVVITSCKKNKVIDNLEPGLIENQTFNSTVLIDGHDYDGTVIRNCVFEDIEGDGLQIRDVDDLCIENCTFKSITENAIRFRDSGGSDGVKIMRNTIFDIDHNGILAAENHINATIRENEIYNVGLSKASSLTGHPHHGIYFQGFNVVILENVIHDVINNDGNCISIRTYGRVAKNILYNATDHGISYYSDHPGDNGLLLIENNFIYNNGKRGVNLASNGTTSNHIGEAVVRFNTIVTSDKSPLSANDGLTGVALSFIGNILIRTDGGTEFIYSSLAYTDSHNLTGSGDLGFQDFTNRNLHINAGSVANTFGTGATSSPPDDIDNELRIIGDIDAGADQLN